MLDMLDGAARGRPSANVDLPPRSLVTGQVPTGPAARRIAAFNVVEKLGEGAFGVVYLAEQERPVRRRVALKVMKGGGESPRTVARFEAERQALALMDHPNIAKIYDAGCTAEGQFYFAMELVRGAPVTDYCDEHGLGVRERLLLFVDVCNAVQHAHQNGVIHRDLKPSNVLVTTHDGRAVAKVIDFGVAKAVQPKADGTLHTERGELVGTPEYMSPEQAEMGPLGIDTRTDVYALGVLLYELLTGARPFDGQDLRHATVGEIQRIIREVEPPRPSTRWSRCAEQSPALARRRASQPETLRRVLRGDLDWIAMRSMEKDRTRRYPTAAALADDVLRHLRHEPVEAGPPGAAYRLQKVLRRHRGPVLVAASIAALLILGTVGMSFLYARAERALQEQTRLKGVADEGRRWAELALAESDLARADGLALLKRYPEAGPLYDEALSGLRRVGASGSVAALALADFYRRSPPPVLTVEAHEAAVWGVLVANDNRHAVSGGDDETVRMTELLDGAAVWSAKISGGRTKPLCFSPDGKLLAVAVGDGPVHFLDARSGQRAFTLEGHAQPVWSGQWSPDGTRFLSASRDRTARLWDLAGRKAIRSLPHPSPVYGARFAGDARHVITASVDGVRYWDVDADAASPAHIWRTEGHEPRALDVAPDGSRALVGLQHGRVWMIDLQGDWKRERQPLPTLILDSVVTHVEFERSGSGWLAASADKTIALGRGSERPDLLRYVYSGHAGKVQTASFSPDGSFIVSGGDDRTVRVWPVKDGGCYREFLGHGGATEIVAWSPDDLMLASANTDATVKVWDVATGLELLTLAHPPKTTQREPRPLVAWGHGLRVATSSGGTLRMWDLGADGPETAASRFPRMVDSLAASRDGRYVAAGFHDGTVRVLGGTGLEPLHEAKAHSSRVFSLAFTRDGTGLLSAGWVQDHDSSSAEGRPTTLQLTETGSWRRAWTGGGTGNIMAVDVDTDGRTVVSAGEPQTPTFWRLDDGARLGNAAGHSYTVWGAALWSGGTVFSGAEDGILKLWDVNGGKELRSFASFGRWIFDLKASPDRRRLACVLRGSPQVILWDFPQAERLHDALRQVPSLHARVRRDPNDRDAIHALGEWYGLRGLPKFATAMLERAKTQGATVSPLALARFYWQSGMRREAREHFEAALRAGEAPDHYLKLCLAAVVAEPSGALVRTTAPATKPTTRVSTPASRRRVTASHTWPRDTRDALNDQIVPRRSNDHDVPRFTWWPKQGTTEWVQYEFDAPTRVTSVEVYWFSDAGSGGACRPPESWRLLYNDRGEWKPCTPNGPYLIDEDSFNNVRIVPVTTTALRLEATLQREYSSGLLEWRVN